MWGSMPQTLEKTIVIDDFYGGIAESDLDIYSKPGEASYIQATDIFHTKEFLRPGYDMVDDSGGVSASNGSVPRVRAYVKRSGTDVLYCAQWFQNTGDSKYFTHILKKASLTGTWSELTVETIDVWAVEPAFALWELNGVLYWFGEKTSAAAAGCVINSYNIGTSTLTENYDDLNVAIWGSPTTSINAGIMAHSDGNHYIFKDRYIGVFDGTTKPSLVTPFALPANYGIVDAISYGHYILIAANDGSNTAVTGAGRTSKLFLLDPYSNSGVYTFDEIYDAQTYNIQGLALVEGRVKVITHAFDYFILDWSGQNFLSNEKKLKIESNGTATDIRRSAIDVKDNVLYFGTKGPSSGSSFVNGIYAYGREKSDSPPALQNAFINHSDTTDAVDYRAIKWSMEGAQILFASWYDQTNYKMSRSSTSRDTANFKYQTIYFRPWRNLRSQPLRVTFYHTALGASDRFTFSMRRDEDAAFTEIDASVGATSSSETVLVNNNSGLSNNFLTGYKHQGQITVASGATGFQLEAIKFKFRSRDL